jgi:hypothetical protein
MPVEPLELIAAVFVVARQAGLLRPASRDGASNNE